MTKNDLLTDGDNVHKAKIDSLKDLITTYEGVIGSLKEEMKKQNELIRNLYTKIDKLERRKCKCRRNGKRDIKSKPKAPKRRVL